MQNERSYSGRGPRGIATLLYLSPCASYVVVFLNISEKSSKKKIEKKISLNSERERGIALEF